MTTAPWGNTKLSNPTAFASMTSMVGPDPYTSDSPWISYLQATDDAQKALVLQNIRRSMSVPNSGPNKQGTEYEYFQTLLRKTGFTKDKGPLGIVGKGEAAALDKVIALARANATDPMTYLQLVAKTGMGGGTVVKQPDTTTKYNKAVSTALQYKDVNDALFAWNNATFAAYGAYPETTSADAFKTAWNAEVNRQKATTTSATTTTYKAIIDPKTKKQVKNKDGVLQYETINSTKTTSTGDDFTKEEQQAFLGDYLSKNFPDSAFDPKTIGGAAKSVYDSLTSAHTNNYDTAPDLKVLAPLIKSFIAAPDGTVGAELLRKYQDDVRSKVSSRFMSIADYVKSGKDANEIIDPLVKTVSQFLEKDITVNDTFMKKILNFQGADGKYRMMNDYELEQALKSHPDFGKTSRAKNESVNLFQSLRGALQ